MSRRWRKVLLLVALLLLLALGTAGMVYGAWAQTLVVSGTAGTGTLSARWLGGGCYVDTDPLGHGLTGTTLQVNPADRTHAVFALHEGYPGYGVECSLRYINDGTIPWTVRGHTILAGSSLTGCTLSGTQTKTLACNEMTVMWWDGIGSEVQPTGTMGSVLGVSITSGSAPSSSYGFTVKHCVAQSNIYLTESQCLAGG